MELKKIIILLVVSFLASMVFAQNFTVKPIFFANESIQIDEETVEFSYETVSSVLTLRNTSSEKILLPVTIVCIPEGYDATYSLTLIPYDFHIIDNEKEIDFYIENDGKKFTRHDSLDNRAYKESRINFMLSFDAMESKRLHINYKNQTYRFRAICDTQHYRMATRYLFNQNSFKKTLLYTPNDIILSSYKGSFLMDFLFKKEDKYFIVDDFVRLYINENYQWRLAVPSDINEVVCRQELFYPLGDFSPYGLLYKHSFPEIKEDVFLGFRSKNLSKDLLSKGDLFTLSKRQLSILRNSFYAKYGYGFKNKEIREYFEANCKGQGVEYKVNPDFSEADFSEAEKANIELIRQMENMTEPKKLSDF